MKNKKLFLILLFVFALAMSVFVAACNKETGDDPVDGEVENTIQSISKSGKSGEEYTVEGVVFATAADGYYIADSTGAIFVSASDSFAVGDKVSVKAKLTLSTGVISVPSFTDATATKLSSGETALTPTVATLKTLTGVSAGRGNFYKYYNVYGTLTEENGVYSLKEDNIKVVFDSRSDTQTLAQYLNKRVDIDVITTGYASSWEVTFIGGAGSIAIHYANLDAFKDDVFASVTSAMPSSVTLSLDLPTTYAKEPETEFTWSVVSGGEAVSVSDNVATVTQPQQNTKVTLKLVISLNDKTAEQQYEVTVKALPVIEISAASSQTGEFITSGQVVAKGFNQTLTRYTLVLSSGNQTYAADVKNLTEYNKYDAGDLVKIAGTYTSADQESLTVACINVTDSVLVSSEENYTVDYSSVECTTLATDADYEALVENSVENSNKLYKIVAPYLIYSGNTTYNFIRFGAKSTASAGYTVNDSKRIFCFARNSMEANVPGFDSYLGVPFLADGAKKYDAYVIYAYALYMGSDTWQFVIPGFDAVVADLGALAGEYIDEAFGETEIDAQNAGTITIPTTAEFVLPDGSTQTLNLTWTSSSDVINVAEGKYSAVNMETEVTLTATYTLDEQTYTHALKVTLVTGPAEEITVTQWLSGEELPSRYVLVAYVASIGTESNSSTDAEGQRNGLVLTDGVNTLWYTEKIYTYENNGATVDIAKGDKVNISGATLNTDNGNQKLSGGTLKVVSSGNDIDYTNLNLYATVESDADLVNLASGMTTPLGGVVVKFTGDFYFVGTGSGIGCRYQLNYKNAASSAAARYKFGDYISDSEGNRTFAFSMAGNLITFPDWCDDFGLPTTGSASKSFEASGTIYAVACYYGKTLYAWSIIAYEPASDASLVAKQLNALNLTYDASAAGSLNLPATITVGENTYNITWTSESTLVDIANGTYSAVTADTEITLTAAYSILGQDYTVNLTATLSAGIEYLTVTQWLTSEELPSSFVLVAYVASIGTQSGNGIEQRNGIILTDGVNTLWYTATTYTYEKDGATVDIAKGDKVNISGATLDKSGGNQKLSGGTLEVISSGNAIDYSKLNLYATVGNDTDLVNLASGMTSPLGGVVVKFTGDFQFVGTGANAVCRYQLNYKNATSSAGAQYAFGDSKSRSFAFSMAANSIAFPNWCTDFGLPTAGSSKTSLESSGTIYAVACGYGDTIYAWSIIAYEVSASV